MKSKSILSLSLGAAVVIFGATYFGTDIFKPEALPPVAEASESIQPEPKIDSAASTESGVLTLTNSITGTVVELNLEEILALPQTTINTENEFVDAMTAFEGPLGRDLMALLGEGGTTVVLTAVNDYAVEVPLEDFMNYDVVFALSANGERFSLRDKGPIWVVYPMSDHSELQDPVYNARLIWQLVKVELK